ncbi:hypothetical protein [Leptolyngbya sp. BC1307]|uniref:hypothetical protein n=1 Tax=Leptolyngbya sp. BC1307 TaxID=2029589 RepID=UPI000EFC557E|nr:hypothetical protein [Leptolyngbya sp. BC1307]
MKNKANQTSRQSSRWTSDRFVRLGQNLEAAYGAGVMSENQEGSANGLGWTREQLLRMSAARSFPFM